MATFEFMMQLSRRLTGAESDAARNAGFDDSLIGSSREGGEIDVRWSADSRDEAIKTATEAIKNIVPDIEVTGIEPIEPLH